MVFDESPPIELENVPNPLPSADLLSEIAGNVLLALQHTPRAVTGSPPSAVISLVAFAVLSVMVET